MVFGPCADEKILLETQSKDNGPPRRTTFLEVENSLNYLLIPLPKDKNPMVHSIEKDMYEADVDVIAVWRILQESDYEEYVEMAILALFSAFCQSDQMDWKRLQDALSARKDLETMMKLMISVYSERKSRSKAAWSQFLDTFKQWFNEKGDTQEAAARKEDLFDFVVKLL